MWLKSWLANWINSKKKHVAERDVVQRIKHLVESYDAIRKGKHRRTPNQLNHEKNFSGALDHVFDIAPKVNYHHRNKHHDFVQMSNGNTSSADCIAEDNDAEAVSNDNYRHQNKHHDLFHVECGTSINQSHPRSLV